MVRLTGVYRSKGNLVLGAEQAATASTAASAAADPTADSWARHVGRSVQADTRVRW
jgi:hypothetical protein